MQLPLPLSSMLMLFVAIFFAGIVDSIAGGAGLITLPAYLLAGVPIHLAYGTNKFANVFGTVFAAFHFGKNKKVEWTAALYAIPGALIGSRIGASTALSMSEENLTLSLVLVLPFAAATLLLAPKFIKTRPMLEMPKTRIVMICLIIGLVVGFYDGFFGPGTGTFLILGYTIFLRMESVTASGTAKIINLASNVGALSAFFQDSSIWFAVGIPCAVCSILGNYLGSHMAVKKGDKVIRPMILVVICLLMVKVVYDYIF